jgi:hypothetical protein
MLICSSAKTVQYSLENSEIIYYVIDTEKILEDNSFDRDTLLDQLNKGVKIIGLTNKTEDLIDRNYLDADPRDLDNYRFFTVQVFTYKYHRCIIFDNRQTIFVYDLKTNEFLGKARKVKDTKICRTAVTNDTLRVIYEFNYAYSGLIDYQITDKGIKLLSKNIRQVKTNADLVATHEFPVTQEYALNQAYKLGIEVQVYNTTYYKLYNNEICVIFGDIVQPDCCVSKNRVYVRDVFTKDFKLDCVYRKGV